MKKIQSKIKALECSQDFPHYKSMEVFSNAQGKLTPQSLGESCRISYLSEILWLSSIPARMKKIRSKMKTLECLQDYRHSRAAYSEVSGGILPKFKLIQAFIVGLVTCKNEEDPIKNEGARVLTRLYDVFSDAQGQLSPKSAAEFCPNSNSSKLL